MTATAEMPAELEDRVIEKIATEKIYFREEEGEMEAQIKFANKGISLCSYFSYG